MLFALWADHPHRPTRDPDPPGRGGPSAGRLAGVFRDAVGGDGLLLDPAEVTAGRIEEGQEYEGVRVGPVARLGQARIDLPVDVGFGAAITPGPVAVRYPGLLGLSIPEVLAYPRETVVAEKFRAMVVPGIANSRMKDVFDLWVLARGFAFDGPVLAGAIRATFARRRPPVPAAPPLALAAGSGADRGKATQWGAFLKKGRLDAGGAGLAGLAGLAGVCELRAGLLLPPAGAAAEKAPFSSGWPPGGPWAAPSGT